MVRILDSVPDLKGSYTVTGKFNILTVTLQSDDLKKKLVALLVDMKYKQIEYFVNDKTQPDNMLNVYDCFRLLRHTFGRFMEKCYNRYLAQADLDYVFNRDNEECNFSHGFNKNHENYIKSISYEERLKSKVTLYFHSTTSKDLVINLNNKFDKKKFRGIIYYV